MQPQCAPAVEVTGNLAQVNALDCPVGRFNAKTSGSTTVASCKGCSVGRFNDQDGQETCKDCETGRFNNKTGQAACKDITGFNDQEVFCTTANSVQLESQMQALEIRL